MSNDIEMQYIVIGRVCNDDDQIHDLLAVNYSDAVEKAKKLIIESTHSYDETDDIYIEHVILGKDMRICGQYIES